eukprot:86343-Pelagomonas_calceolata.AAC.1
MPQACILYAASSPMTSWNQHSKRAQITSGTLRAPSSWTGADVAVCTGMCGAECYAWTHSVHAFAERYSILLPPEEQAALLAAAEGVKSGKQVLQGDALE